MDPQLAAFRRAMLIGAGATLALVPAAVGGTWTRASVGGTDDSGGIPRVAIDGSGRAVVAWTETLGDAPLQGAVRIRRWSGSRWLKTAFPDSRSGSFLTAGQGTARSWSSAIDVGIDRAGTAALAWRHDVAPTTAAKGNQLLWLARETTEGVVFEYPTHSTSNAGVPAIAVSAAGDAVSVTRTGSRSYVEVAVRSARRIVVDGAIRAGISSGPVAVGISKSGRALVVWVARSGAVRARVVNARGIQPAYSSKAVYSPTYARPYAPPYSNVLGNPASPQRVFPSPAFTLAPGGSYGGSLSVAVSPGGRAVVTWVKAGRRGRVVATVGRIGGRFGPVRSVSPAGVAVSAPYAAIGARGHAAIVWRQTRASAKAGSLAISRLGRRDRWGASVGVTSERGSGLTPARLGIDATGAATIIWQSDYVSVRRQALDGTFGSARRISGELDRRGTGQPVIAVNARGRAIAAWESGNSNCCKNVFAAIYRP